MELDQLLFGKISSFFERIKNKPTEEELNRTFFLEPNKSMFTILARALTGKPIEVITAEREGGWKDDKFFLPIKFLKFPTLVENEQLYWFRLFYLSTIVNNKHRLTLLNQSGLIEKESSFNKEVLVFLFEEFPSIKPIHDNLLLLFQNSRTEEKSEIDYSWLYGKWMNQSLIKDDLSKDISTDINVNGLPTPKTEIKAKAVDEVESIQVDKEQQEEYMLTHNFEKTDTAEEFNGNWRDFDGSDELEDHQEALDQVHMNNTVRVDDQTHSVYQSEFISDAVIPESSELIPAKAVKYTYDEWDYSKGMYLENYCSVYAEKPLSKNDEYVQNTIKENGVILRNLRKQFASFFNDLKKVRKLSQGEELDMDCITDLICDIKAKTTPDDRVYNSKRKLLKDVSILFLLDLSLSSDGYASGNRILDIEKQISILMGEMLEEYGISFQVDGFNSKTRNHCGYYTFKSFNDNWVKTRANIAAAIPEGYTRIGPALRHAKTLIQKEGARKKWVVILSDGKPNDYDRYEGKHGINDIKQAIRELKESDVRTHTFAIEENAKFYLPLIFGQSDYNVLSSPKEMIQSMALFCQKVVNQ